MSASDSAYEECARIVREADRDRWLASLFIPAPSRLHVLAFYAFSHEIARAGQAVSDPRLGEIRLQWWREALQGERAGEAQANPVSQALLSTMASYRLLQKPLLDLIEARRFDLYADPMPSLNDLEGYCGETCSSLFQLAALVCNDGVDPDAADVSGHAGCAYAMAGLLRALPWHVARGQCWLPKDVLARHGALPEAVAAGLTSPALLRALEEMRGHARAHLASARAGMASLPESVRPIFAPLAFVEPWLSAMERKGYDPFRTIVDPPQWRLQWALWRW